MALIKLTDIAVDSLDNASLEQGYLYKDLFLEKSNTTESEWEASSKWNFHLLDGSFDLNEGWFTYAVDNKNNIFYIGSLFYNGDDRGDTNNAFIYLKQFAKRKNCKKIIFWTARNGKSWKRRFKNMKITGWRMEVSL